MDELKKINEDFWTGQQPTPEDLEQLAKQGIKSVFNLRSPDETGVLSDEQQQAESVGLQYANVPLQPTVADDPLTEEVIAKLEDLPTPVFFHCGAGARASALGLIALARQQKLSYDEVLKKAQELKINTQQPHLKSFLEHLKTHQ